MSLEIIQTSHQTIGRNVLLYPLLRKLQVAEIINRKCFCEAEIPYGTIAEVIILSRFAPKRVPMYQLDTFCQTNGLDVLYGIDSSQMNDDRAGRCLDAMHDSLAEMKTTLILGAIKNFNLKVHEIHTDITNILFEGSYKGIEEGQLQVTYKGSELKSVK